MSEAEPPQRCSGDCGCFIEYDISGNIFELTSKYRLPVEKSEKALTASFETNQTVAIKKIEEAFDDRDDARRTLREIKILRHFDHENIISIRDVIPPPRKEDFVDVYVVFDRMDTDLDRIIASSPSSPLEHCKQYLYQILRGLKYIHSANVVHLDLKPSNILVNNADHHLKICDFGSVGFTSSETDDTTGSVVTRWYRAPELLLGSRDYTPATDMWSVGCIFMELMALRPLFAGRDDCQQLGLILEAIGSPTEAELGVLDDGAKECMRLLPRFRPRLLRDKFPNMNQLGVDLAERMLTFDPKRRITAEDALAHPYLAGLHDTSKEPTCLTFSIQFERVFTKDQMRELVFQESLGFNPHMREHY